MKTRREFLTTSLLAGAGLAISSRLAFGNNTPGTDFSINVFSKNLQWLGFEDMAKVAADIGFEGLDLTVRPNGHVKPERVADDLPRAVDAARKAGIKIPMITTAILSADDPHAETTLKTAASLGVSSYRMGWMQYDESISVDDNLKKFETAFQKLDALNEKYKIRGEYQNHSGAYLGSAVWDVAGILKKFRSANTALQYDILHATVEGANAWPVALKNIASHVTSMPIKDFQWTRKDGKSTTELVPLGEGIVDFKKYFKLVKAYSIHGPFSMHFEYPLGGIENGTISLTIPEKDVVSAMKRDLTRFRQMLKENGIRG